MDSKRKDNQTTVWKPIITSSTISDVVPILNPLCNENQSFDLRANGLRYLRWGGDGEAVQPEK